jgi:hypothetical protein
MQPRQSASPWLQAALAGIFAVALLGGCAKQEATSTDTPATAEAPASEGEPSTESAAPSEETPAAPTTEGQSEAPKQ